MSNPRPADEMIAGLEEFCDCLRDGVPIEERFIIDELWITDRDRDHLLAALDREDIKPSEALRKAFERHRQATGPVAVDLPAGRDQIAEIQAGRQRHTLAPFADDRIPQVGSLVRFYEQGSDPFGVPYAVANGREATVRLARVTPSGDRWGGMLVCEIAWDAPQGLFPED